jgi:tetratricopeptide (TPR) repeat protein
MRIHVWMASAALALLPSVAGAGHPSRDLNDGLHAMIAGDYVRAEPALRRAIEHDPNNGIARFNYAATLRALGRNDQALAEYRAALGLIPTSDPKSRADVLYGIALTSDDMGDPIRAARAWNDYVQYAQRYIQEQPSVEIARTRLAAAQRLAGIRVAPLGTQKAGR